MKKKFNIGIDMDGVLYPFADEFKKFVENKFNRNLRFISNKWSFYEDWGYSKEEFDLLHQEFTEKGLMEKGEPIKDAIEIMDQLYKDNHNIFIITHRYFDNWNDKSKSSMMNSTINWLLKYNIRFHNILFIKEKDLISLDFILDDAVHNLKSFNNSKTIPICFNHRYNQEWKGERVYNWGEFYIKIFNKSIENEK